MPGEKKHHHACWKLKQKPQWLVRASLLSCICLSGCAKRDSVVEDEGCKHVKELIDIKKTDKWAFWDFLFDYQKSTFQVFFTFQRLFCNSSFSDRKIALLSKRTLSPQSCLPWLSTPFNYPTFFKFQTLFIALPWFLTHRPITQQQQGEGGDSEDAKQCQITRLHRESSFSENCLSEAWQRNIFSANCFRSTKVSALRSFLRIQPECLRSLMS